MGFDPNVDYPLGLRRPDLVSTPSGRSLDEVTLDGILSGAIGAEELRATPETLRRQAAIARVAGRSQLADNLEQAAELANVPTETILEIYAALRPNRSSAADLEEWAQRLEAEWDAPQTAAFVREAAEIYASRGLLAGERAQV
jgi:propanediol dehydratase small subunit